MKKCFLTKEFDPHPPSKLYAKKYYKYKYITWIYQSKSLVDFEVA